jgi:hypothetical protein
MTPGERLPAAAVCRIELDRTADYRHVRIRCSICGEDANSYVGLKTCATGRQGVSDGDRDSESKRAMSRRTASHRDDLAGFELMLQLADAFVGGIGPDS